MSVTKHSFLVPAVSLDLLEIVQGPMPVVVDILIRRMIRLVRDCLDRIEVSIGGDTQSNANDQRSNLVTFNRVGPQVDCSRDVACRDMTGSVEILPRHSTSICRGDFVKLT